MGGYNFPNVGCFLEVQWWMVHLKTFQAGGRAAALIRYLIGWPMLKWGWCVKDLTKPMSMLSPVYYLRMRRFFQDNHLQELGEGALKKESLWKWLRRGELPTNIFGLNPKKAEVCWKNLLIKGITNRQKEVVWLSLHNCLSTMSFLKSRDLVRREVCPREGCGGIENTRHVFWECFFVKKVWKLLCGFIQRVVEVEGVSYEAGVLGLVEGDKRKKRKMFVISAVVREVIWETRCAFVKKKMVVSGDDCVEWVLAKMFYVLAVDRRSMGVEEANVFWSFGRWRVGVG